jgi:S1-C subfamily serine protease
LVIRDHMPDSVAVVPGSPAQKAGIKENDIITHIHGRQLSPDSDLTDTLQKYHIGDQVDLTILRGKETMPIVVTLEERKA